ncbi:BON1-associated protein 2 [Striga hermonthica]|uniref:BON1-associated protein 2 n=1 Tax=Striga hermonthica TaxID=68872 RepID=A0A9N7P374_STRHE|nr:BON1-associated protein 2 [Striga hermonthica]
MLGKKACSMSIEVTVISAEGLQKGRDRPVKKDAFVVVRSDPFTSRSTRVDRDGGSYPFWNQKLTMELPENTRFITVEAHAGNRVIGVANIPVEDFAGGQLPENYLSFLSYRLRDGRGGKNGIINVSVKVNRRSGGGGGLVGRRPVGVVKAEDGGICGGGGGSGNVVTGIPVSYRF